MTFAQYFRTSSYCLIASGFIALLSSGSVDRASVALFGAAFMGSLFLDTARIRRSIPNWALNCLGIVYLPFCVLDYRYLSHSVILALIHLLFFTAAVKLLTLSKDRDYLLLYFISLAQLLAASILTVTMLFAVCFVAFLFSSISTLIAFEMRRTNARIQKEVKIQPVFVPEKLRGTGMELFSPFPAGLLATMVLGITVLILLVAVPIFFVLPRVTFGLYKHPSGSMQFTSGFSERVELGQIGNIKQSDAVVMRVKMDRSRSELPANLKWRGLAFDYYDGRAWKRTNAIHGTIPAQGWHYKLENSTQGTNWINQTFFLEALSTDVIFATHKALAVSRDIGPLFRDDAENLYAPRPRHKKLRYSVISDPIRPNPANISDLRPIPPEILKIYMQVPPEDPRIEKLAKKVTVAAKDRYAKALALEQYLRTNYGYSLALRGTPNSPDPLAMFLFDVRSGHCEYFASAMTIMLRQLGIPARLVNGFRTGEYNTLGNSWTVRQYHAHSWVEAYFPPYGWIEFDPTPTETRPRKTGLLLALSNLADAIDLWWWDGVVNYDLPKQSLMLDLMRGKTENLFRNVKALMDIIKARMRHQWRLFSLPGIASSMTQRWVICFLFIAAAALLFMSPVRKRIVHWVRRTVHREDARIVASSFFMEALALLEAAGMRHVRGQTPMEFAQSIGRHPAGKPFQSLTRMYNAARFGPPDTPFQRSDAEALLHALRDALKIQRWEN
jgi:transglutaminase-like putative cysteine protease